MEKSKEQKPQMITFTYPDIPSSEIFLSNFYRHCKDAIS